MICAYVKILRLVDALDAQFQRSLVLVQFIKSKISKSYKI